ncbi:MAG: cob(I)yrinic acid a,c-diamide adenosyltransferase [Thiohalospira sp.]
MTDSDRDARHAERMARKKAVVDERIRNADDDRGVVVVNTGTGKGKSTAGFGMIARALGHGQQVGIVQFIKGSFSTGEEAFFRQFDAVAYHVMGEGYTWETQDRERDTEAAATAWAHAAELLADPTRSVVLLDEINIAFKYGYLEPETVIAALDQRPHHQSVVLTGRGAPDALVEYADTVTDMTKRKHAFEAGVKARKGVEL